MLTQIYDDVLLGGAEGSLQVMSGMRAVVEVGSGLPFADSVWSEVEPLSEHSDGLIASSELSSDSRRSACILPNPHVTL